jgi:hypothetical protein
MDVFTTCPACDYTRIPSDNAPNWQCPKCQKAYIKTASLLQKNKDRIHSHPTDNFTEYTSNLNAERKKSNFIVVVVLIAAVLGACLYFLYQPRVKETVTSPIPVASVKDEELPYKQILANANSYFGFVPAQLVRKDKNGWSDLSEVNAQKDQWLKASENWVQKSIITAQHISENAGSLALNAAAQSFIPHCDIIRAIHINLYPIGGTGWIRFEITDDGGGTPSQVLDTAWLRIDGDCQVPVQGYMIVPFADVAVNPNHTYWFTIVEFRDSGAKTNITNLGSLDTDTYAEGKLLLPAKYKVPGIFDTNFRIVKEYKSLPGIRAASDSEKQKLPSLNEQEAVRRIWTQEMPRNL